MQTKCNRAIDGAEYKSPRLSAHSRKAKTDSDTDKTLTLCE